MIAIAWDYASTHVDSFQAIPSNALEMIDMWLKQQHAEDAARLQSDDSPYPSLVQSGREFAARLEHHREQDREVLDPELIRVMDDFRWRLGQAMMFVGFAKQGLASDAAENERVALRTLVEATRDFATVFLRLEPKWIEIQSLTRNAASEINAAARVRRNEDARRDTAG